MEIRQLEKTTTTGRIKRRRSIHVCIASPKENEGEQKRKKGVLVIKEKCRLAKSCAFSKA